jgi:hypothetical protein
MVSSALKDLARVGTANAKDEIKDEMKDALLCFTPPYDKSGCGEQMR